MAGKPSKTLTFAAFIALIGVAFAQNPRQLDILEDPRKNKIIIAGRRFGKSFVAAIIAVAALVAGYHIWWVVPKLTLGRAGIGYVKKFLERLKRARLLTYTYKATPHPAFYCSNGGLLEFRTTGVDPRKADLVSEGIDLLVLEEASRIKHLVELFDEQLAPTLLDRGGRVVAITTPRGKRCSFHQWKERFAQYPDDWAILRYSSLENKTLNEQALNEVVSRLTPQLVQQEIFAEELDEYGKFFPHVPVSKVALPLRREVWAWDWSDGGVCAFERIVEDHDHRICAYGEALYGRHPWEKQIAFARKLVQQGHKLIIDGGIKSSPHLLRPLLRENLRFEYSTREREHTMTELRAWLNTEQAYLALDRAEQGKPVATCGALQDELETAEIDEFDP